MANHVSTRRAKIARDSAVGGTLGGRSPRSCCFAVTAASPPTTSQPKCLNLVALCNAGNPSLHSRRPFVAFPRLTGIQRLNALLAEPSLERRPVVCRQMASHHSNNDPSCAERRRVISRATTRRVPRDNAPSLERRPVVCREITRHQSSDDPSCAERRRVITRTTTHRVPRDD